MASVGVSGQIVHGFDEVIELFMKYGAVHSFFMFLGGAGGNGKGHDMHTPQTFCSEFCQKNSLLFEINYIIRNCSKWLSSIMTWRRYTVFRSRAQYKKLLQELPTHWYTIQVLIIN